MYSSNAIAAYDTWAGSFSSQKAVKQHRGLTNSEMYVFEKLM